MNKGQLIDTVYQTGTFDSKAAAGRAVDVVIEAISSGLKKDGEARIVNFGTFTVRKRKARTGRNPQTGEAIKIKASKTVGFRAGTWLKSTVKNTKVKG